MHQPVKVKTVAGKALKACCLPAVLAAFSVSPLLAQQQQPTDAQDQSQQAQPQQGNQQQDQPQNQQRTDQQQTQQFNQQNRQQFGQQQEQQQQEQQQQEQQQPQQPFLGVRLEPSPTTGTRVTAVMPGGPADRAGIRVGDYILAIDDQKVNSAEELTQQIGESQFGDQIALSIWRNGRPMNVTATLQRVQMPSSQAGQRQSNYGSAPPDQPGEQGMSSNQQTPWIGVTLTDPQSGQQGAVVRAVFPSGPAAFAGLDSGDVITQIAGQEVTSPQQAAQVIQGLELNQETQFTILRNGQQQTVTVQPAARSDFFGAVGQTYQNYGSTNSDSFDQFAGIPAHAMMLEQHRRFAQQHQRIEQMIMELREEVRQLRQELQQSRGAPPQ